MSEFTAAMAFTVPSEGGYQCIHGDPGNWTSGRVGAGALIGTNRGVSAPVLAAWLGREPTVADMKALTATTQNAIFAAGYWNPIRGDELPPGVSLSTYDMQVNAGKGGAECLQEAAGLSGDDVDGWIGPATLTALARTNTPDIATHLSATAGKALQSALGVQADGEVGPNTLTALAALPDAQSRALAICCRLFDEQSVYYRKLSGFAEFGHTWLTRAAGRLDAAIKRVQTIT